MLWATASLLILASAAVAQDSFAPPTSSQPDDDCPDDTAYSRLTQAVRFELDPDGEGYFHFVRPRQVHTGMRIEPGMRLNTITQGVAAPDWDEGPHTLSDKVGVGVGGGDLAGAGTHGGTPGGGGAGISGTTIVGPGDCVRGTDPFCAPAWSPGSPPQVGGGVVRQALWPATTFGLGGTGNYQPPGGGSAQRAHLWVAHRNAARMVAFTAGCVEQARIHLPSGATLGFERLTTIDLSDGSGSSAPHEFYTLRRVRDAWDNEMELVRNASGRLIKTVASPDPNSSTETWTWTWARDLANGPSGASFLAHSRTVLENFSTPDLSWAGVIQWAPRNSGHDHYGGRPVSQTFTSVAITTPTGTSAPITTARSWTADGWSSEVETGDGTEIVYDYTNTACAGRPTAMTHRNSNGQGPALSTAFVWDRWGNLVSQTERSGSVLASTTTYEHDVQGRVLEATVAVVDNDVNGNPQTILHERQFLRDFWGNVAVDRLWNRDSKGQKPARHGQSSNARDWIVTDRYFDGDRLLREFVDRRALDEGDSGPLSDALDARFLEIDYTHYADGTLHSIELPNGASREFVVDGYGTVYSQRVTNGTDEVYEGRYFVDGAMNVVKVFQGDKVHGPNLWTTIERDPATGVVTGVTEPVNTPFTGSYPYAGEFGGAVHKFVHDGMGRVVDAKTYDPGNLPGSGSDPFIARVETDYDELGRAYRRRTHAADTGSTVYQEEYFWSGI